MAAITSIDMSTPGAVVAALTTLTASDTITFNPKRKQLLVLRNPTGGTLTLKIDGADGTTVDVPGIGPVSVAGGYDIALTTLQSKAVVLSSIKYYCQGVVTLTGAADVIAQLFDL
jgi:hypothetical protein